MALARPAQHLSVAAILARLSFSDPKLNQSPATLKPSIVETDEGKASVFLGRMVSWKVNIANPPAPEIRRLKAAG